MDKVGLRWYKCDFHLHTMASKCYVDKQIDTLQEWINTAKQKGLECIAVTDHNDYRSIDEAMKIGKENNLIVFPGVELSCDSSKIHILVLFDIDCDGNTVQEFLSQLKIFRADLGDSSHTADGDIFHAYDLIDDSEINEILDDDLKDFNSDIESIYKILHDIVKKSDKIVEKINATNWNHRKIENGENYLQAVKNLQDNGLDTGRLDELIDKRKDKKQELEIIRNKEQELEALEQEYNEKEKIYKEKNADIYNLRSQFIQEVIGNVKSVKFDLKKNRNRSSFINNIRSIIQKDIVSVEDDINKLADIFFKDKNGIKNYKELIVNIRTKQDQTSLSKYTRDAVCGLPEDSYARLLAYIPDDDLVVSYKPEKAKKFIHLSNASAGQKTTTILTFLLAYGKQPLLLDQPEDDLDNRLVYDLIVARLKVAKSKRQIIVVTHNANIPVNGDSEYIISMNSDTDIIQVNKTGTMDDTEIRQEICDEMEGTKDAFEMRSKIYHFNISE